MHSLISNNLLGGSRSHVGVIIINSNALQSLIYTSASCLSLHVNSTKKVSWRCSSVVCNVEVLRW